MRKLQIRDAEVMQIAIRQEISRSEESRYDHRLHGILLVANGPSCGAVAELFGENARTVQRWVSRFESGAFEALREGERAGRPCSLDSRQWRALECDLRRNPRQSGHEQNLWDGKLLSAHLKSRYRISLGVRQCQRIFGKMGFACGSPELSSPKPTPCGLRRLKKLRRLARRADTELWNLDECHFQQHGTRTRMWARPEVKDPVQLRAPTRKSMACFGTVSLFTGKFVHSIVPKFNAVTFEVFLRKLQRHRSRARRMVLVLDNAAMTTMSTIR